MVRHGERADEVEDSQRLRRPPPRSRKDVLDPPLTEEGHRQAREAFERILPTLRGKRVAVFVSPLRRTMATAAMIGAVDAGTSDVEFVVPRRRRRSLEDEDDDDDGVVPLVVANGLSDCAAYVVRVGGAFSAVRSGYVDGAAMPANNLRSSPHTPLMSMVEESISIHHARTRRIRFYKELRAEDENDKANGESGPFYDGRIVPMSPPLGRSNREEVDAKMIGDAGVHGSRRRTPSPPVHRGSLSPPGTMRTETNLAHDPDTVVRIKEDNFKYATNRAVQLAAEANCDVCILVTHREGIRYKARQILRNKHVRFSTPYCCVGRFRASVGQNDDGDCNVEWFFEEVCPYQRF